MLEVTFGGVWPGNKSGEITRWVPSVGTVGVRMKILPEDPYVERTKKLGEVWVLDKLDIRVPCTFPYVFKV